MSRTTKLMSANLRKGKASTFILVWFIVLASMFLTLGLMMMTHFTDAYDNKSEALHAPHIVIMDNKADYAQAHLDYVSGYKGVRETETVNMLTLKGDITFDGKPDPWDVFFSDAAATNKMNGLTLVEGAAPKNDDEVCVPYIFRVSGGYGLGDTFRITVGTTELSYKISGFTEELMFGTGSGMMKVTRIYLTPGAYAALEDKHPNWATVVINARLENPADAGKLANQYNKKFFVDSRPESGTTGSYAFTYDTVKGWMTGVSTMVAMIIVAFSAVLGAVALLVIRFRIRNTVEETMTNLGALKATGYTGGQLLGATLLQFALIAAVGASLGIGNAYGVLPGIAAGFEQVSGLHVPFAFDPVSTVVAFVMIMVTVMAVVWLSARPIRKLAPLTALKLGLARRSFKRNHFPVDRARGPLAWLLAAKTALHAKGQAVMLFVIILGVGFASGVGASMYDNLAAHTDDFVKTMLGETPDLTVTAETAGTAQDVRALIESASSVGKSYFVTSGNVLYDDLLVPTIAVEDYGQFEGRMLYDGRYPAQDNEIAVTSDLGKRIGDSIKVSLYGKSAEYQVVGLIQGQLQAAATTGGYLRLDPGARPKSIWAYLDDPSKTAALIKSIDERFGNDKVQCTDVHEANQGALATDAAVFLVVTLVILAMTLLVVLLSVWLLMKTMITRRRQEFGVMKTVGFTTRQIMNQLASYFMPIVATGLVGGGIIGAVSFNPVFVGLTRSMGIMTSNMPTPWGLTLVMCGALILVAYAFAMLVAWRTRKISPVELVTE